MLFKPSCKDWDGGRGEGSVTKFRASAQRYGGWCGRSSASSALQQQLFIKQTDQMRVHRPRGKSPAAQKLRPNVSNFRQLPSGRNHFHQSPTFLLGRSGKGGRVGRSCIHRFLSFSFLSSRPEADKVATSNWPTRNTPAVPAAISCGSLGWPIAPALQAGDWVLGHAQIMRNRPTVQSF